MDMDGRQRDAAAWLLQIQRDWDIVRNMTELTDAGDHEAAEQLYRQFLARYFNRGIALTGNIVDSEGRPVSDVTLEICINRHVDDITSMHETRTTHMASATFELCYEGCAAMSIKFTKAGYHSKKIEVVSYADDNPTPGRFETAVVVTMSKKEPSDPTRTRPRC